MRSCEARKEERKGGRGTKDIAKKEGTTTYSRRQSFDSNMMRSSFFQLLGQDFCIYQDETTTKLDSRGKATVASRFNFQVPVPHPKMPKRLALFASECSNVRSNATQPRRDPKSKRLRSIKSFCHLTSWQRQGPLCSGCRTYPAALRRPQIQSRRLHHRRRRLRGQPLG